MNCPEPHFTKYRTSLCTVIEADLEICQERRDKKRQWDKKIREKEKARKENTEQREHSMGVEEG